MPKVLFERDGRIGRITLNRPDVMNAIDDDLPGELADAVARADADAGVHVMVLSGAGKAFRSTLPTAVSGSASSGSSTAGTM